MNLASVFTTSMFALVTIASAVYKVHSELDPCGRCKADEVDEGAGDDSGVKMLEDDGGGVELVKEDDVGVEMVKDGDGVKMVDCDRKNGKKSEKNDTSATTATTSGAAASVDIDESMP